MGMPDMSGPATRLGSGGRHVERSLSRHETHLLPTSTHPDYESDASDKLVQDDPTRAATDASEPRARSRWKRCAGSSEVSPTPSTARSSAMPDEQLARAWEGTAGRLFNPAVDLPPAHRHFGS